MKSLLIKGAIVSVLVAAGYAGYAVTKGSPMNSAHIAAEDCGSCPSEKAGACKSEEKAAEAKVVKKEAESCSVAEGPGCCPAPQ